MPSGPLGPRSISRRRESVTVSRPSRDASPPPRAGAALSMTLSDGRLRARDDVVFAELAAQAAEQPYEIHAEVADQRPEGIGERRRAIVLDEEVREPREGVAREGHQQQQPPDPRRDRGGDHDEHQRRADEVDDARRRLAVLFQIEGPELAIGLNRRGHGRLRTLWPRTA